MSTWKKLLSSISKRGREEQMVPGKEADVTKTFSSLKASDIGDDSMTLEIFRGPQADQAEMAVSILWDEKYEVFPPDDSRTYSAREVGELLELVVAFAVEQVRGNVIDRVVYPHFYEKEYREPTA